ncbi:M14 family metallopeptidase [Robiginitalea sp. IMCC43444]|uniref:M14 family metallopeptidase n=1 Tax=Robiginitalea sp. IMCC43444 TaxID=3459121 RepID=UPI0040418560
MSKILLIGLLGSILLLGCNKTEEEQKAEFPTPFEKGDGNTTATYREALEFYMSLAREFPEINIQTIGETDSDLPLHLVTYNAEGNFNFQRLGREKGILFILNGIHPGESDGIDASMQIFRDLAAGTLEVPEDIILVTIPVYNVGGALNRNSNSRANQNGPGSYGFRGNARNFDLNRDFLKMDTRNARTFAEIFHLVKPDLFLDTHVSNGADYTYTLTHLFSQHNKLGGALGDFQENVLLRGLENDLKEKGWDITPYVNVFNRSPEMGFSQFMDYPRYSTGYVALWNTPGLMLETHMLKPYAQRVKGTYSVIESLIGLLSEQKDSLQDIREKSLAPYAPGSFYPTKWAVDSTDYRELDFKGFELDTLISEVSGQDRIKYDRNRPYQRSVPYYNQFRATDSVRIPSAYLLPKAWKAVRERLDWNKIKYTEFEKDSSMQVTVYHIDSYKTYTRAYEGHYPHYDTQLRSSQLAVLAKAGDLLVSTEQEGVRYLMECLEPQAADSFFNWNFFDTILQRKEGFSPYVFEEVALELLQSDSLLRQRFEARRLEDAGFNENGYRQLEWIYENSPYYEEAHLQYPIYRIE